jgi:hypothetical protein
MAHLTYAGWSSPGVTTSVLGYGSLGWAPLSVLNLCVAHAVRPRSSGASSKSSTTHSAPSAQRADSATRSASRRSCATRRARVGLFSMSAELPVQRDARDSEAGRVPDG